MLFGENGPVNYILGTSYVDKDFCRKKFSTKENRYPLIPSRAHLIAPKLLFL